MTTISTKETIFLGNYSDADTNEGSIALENSSIYTGVFGSAGAPLFTNEVNVEFTDTNDDGNFDVDNIGGETIRYDLGAGTITTAVDSLVVASLDVTYKDGSTVSYTNAVMFQDATGNLFLTNSNFAGTNLNTASLIQSINVTSIDSGGYTQLIHTAFQEFVCYASGTRVRTPAGDVLIDDLNVGDFVLTQDHGAQPILWIKGKTVPRTAKMTPVRIRAGALGPNCPARDLLVSQQHRILVRSKILKRLTNKPEAYVIAKKLTALAGIDYDTSNGPVTYFHLMCENHEVIFAEGAPSETLLPGPQALSMMGKTAAQQLLSVFPTLQEETNTLNLARHEVKGDTLRKLILRHQNNGRHISHPNPICA